MSVRPFCLMVDSANRDEPPVRYFGSLDAARAAALALPKEWHPFVWITEWYAPDSPIHHVRDGCGL